MDLRRRNNEEDRRRKREKERREKEKKEGRMGDIDPVEEARIELTVEKYQRLNQLLSQINRFKINGLEPPKDLIDRYNKIWESDVNTDLNSTG